MLEQDERILGGMYAEAYADLFESSPVAGKGNATVDCLTDYVMLSKLDQRSKFVLVARLWLLGFRNIGAILNISPERVRQIEGRSIIHLRRSFKWNALKGNERKALQRNRARAMYLHLENLDWSVRAQQAFAQHGVTTLGELSLMTEAKFLCCKNCGRETLDEVKETLAEFGLTFGEVWEDSDA